MGQGQHGTLGQPPAPMGREAALPVTQSVKKLPSFTNCPGGKRVRDRYVVKRNLGLGAFGVVDFACDKEPPHRAVAIKTFRADMQAQLSALHGERIETRMWEEVTLQSRCKNRHVLQVIEWFGTDSKLEGFALEYCSGGSLKERVDTFQRSGERLTEAVVARWMIHILTALEHIHAMKIIHRDVKLENVLISSPEDDMLKLSDFGMAVDVQQDRVVTARVGTPFYMAPEVIAGRGYNAKIDCWSAGVAFLYLLDAHTPLFNAEQVFTDVPLVVADIRWRDTGPPLEALRLLENLLTHSAPGRWSARRALSHHFLQNGLGSLKQGLSSTRSTTMASGPDVDVSSNLLAPWNERKPLLAQASCRSPSRSLAMCSPCPSSAAENEERPSRRSTLHMSKSPFRCLRGKDGPCARGASSDTESEKRSSRRSTLHMSKSPFRCLRGKDGSCARGASSGTESEKRSSRRSTLHVPMSSFRCYRGENCPRAGDALENEEPSPPSYLQSSRRCCVDAESPHAPGDRTRASGTGNVIGDDNDICVDGNATKKRRKADKMLDEQKKLFPEEDLTKIKLIIAMFDERQSGKLNLMECQNMFDTANPARSSGSPYPDKKLYKKLAKSSEDGLSPIEIYRLMSGSSEYISKLYRKICKWKSNDERRTQSKGRGENP